MVDVTNEVRRISLLLGRTIAVTFNGSGNREASIVQTCPMCAIQLNMTFITETEQLDTLVVKNQRVDPDWLHRELFSFYDQHTCTVTDVMALYEAAERELVRSAERMLALDGSDLRARAELEADRMAAFADRIRKRMG